MSKESETLDNEIDLFYNKQEKFIKNKLKEQTKDFGFVFSYTDEDEYIVDIFDDEKHSKHILRATYEILGCYNINCSIWSWAWAMSFVEKNLVKQSNKIRKYADVLENGNITNKIEQYWYLCRNPSFFISYKNLNTLIKLSLFISKDIWIVPRKVNEMTSNKNSSTNEINSSNPSYNEISPCHNIVEFIILKKILQEK